MKHLLSIAVLIFAALATTFTGCKKEESILGAMEITVASSATFPTISVEGIEVIVTNSVDNTTVSAITNSLGVAMVTDLAPGTYSITATMNLTAEEAFEQTGVSKEVTLNAALNDVVLLQKETKLATITLDGKSGASLVIREIYSTGASNDSYSIMFKDNFFEIYNNSESVEYLDGLYIAYLAPQRAGGSASDIVTTLPIGDYVYAVKILQFPGTGTQYPIQPGTAQRVAINAVNYLLAKPNATTVDNSTANFDTYAIEWLQTLGRTGNSYFDLNNPDVPTMNCIYLNITNGGFFNLDNSASLALLKLDANPSANTIVDPDILTSSLYYIKLPSANIIDGVDMLESAGVGKYKRLPSAIDAGFTYNLENGRSNYTGRSVRRKVAKTLSSGRVVLMDTNNSTNDFTSDLVTNR